MAAKMRKAVGHVTDVVFSPRKDFEKLESEHLIKSGKRNLIKFLMDSTEIVPSGSGARFRKVSQKRLWYRCVVYYRRSSIIDGRVLIHCSSFLVDKNEINEK